MSKSTKRKKPAKPRPDFPLTPHATGRWCKKVRGKLHYFGPWEDPKAAEALWIKQRDDLLAGRVPADDHDLPTVADVCNAFLRAKKKLVDAGELAPRTFSGYLSTAELLVHHFGRTRPASDLRPDDFNKLRADLAERFASPITMRVQIHQIRSIFNWGFEAGTLDIPARFGPDFRGPRQKIVDQHVNAKGDQGFEAQEIRDMLGQANDTFSAMILLAVNCGFGNTDIAALPIDAIDFKKGWADHPRPKTAVSRRIPLWPETLSALRGAIANRPEPADPEYGNRVFLTPTGLPWVRHRTLPNGRVVPRNGITDQFQRLFKKWKVKSGRKFYDFRRTFETEAGNVIPPDQIAVDAIMGHKTPGMGTVYRQRIADDRLRAVTDHVHAWLFGEG